jgi:ABC-type phosphate/phosphonate transport system substrate-binding protein
VDNRSEGQRPWFARGLMISAYVLACVVGSACRQAPAPTDYLPSFSSQPPLKATGTQYSFGVRPIRNTKLLWDTYAPLLREVNANLSSFQVTLESALTETTFDTKLRRGELDAALVEPHRVLDLGPCGYSVFARAGDRDKLAGVIVARKDLNIRRARDLRGQVICFSSPGALASTMLVKVYLKKAGLDSVRHSEVRHTGSSDSSLLNLLAGDAAAAGVSRSVWERFVATKPDSANILQALWRTDELPGPALMVHSRIPPEHVNELRSAFVALSKSEAGQRALAAAGLQSFEVAESATYDSLWEFLHEYQRLFGEVPVLGGRR